MSLCTAIRSDFRSLRLLLGLLGTGLALVSLGCGSEVSESACPGVSTSFRYLPPEELKAMIDQGEVFNLVDTRSVQEYLAGHLPNAISIPYRELPYRYTQLDPQTTTVVYCETGLTGILAAQALARLGFSDLYSLAGGFAGWEYAVELSNGHQVI